MVAPQEGALPNPAVVRFAVAALAATLLLAACSDEVDAPGAPTLTATPSPSPAPTVTPDLGLLSFTLAPATALPAGIALLLETGCFQCDGPATGLIRVGRSADGVSRRDLLLSAGVHALYGEGAGEALYFAGDLPIPRETITTSKDQHLYEPYVTGIATGPDGSEIVVSVCVYPGCAVGMDAWSENGRVALYRATDGGETWSDFGTIDGGGVLGIVSPGEILAYSPTGSDGPTDFFVYPERTSVTRPETASPVGVLPSVLADGTVVWRDRGNTVRRPDGSVILQLPTLPGVYGPWSIGEVLQQPFGDRLIAVEWAANYPGDFLSVFEADGSHLRTLMLDRALHGGAWVSDTALIANVRVDAGELAVPPPAFYPGLIPALIDIEAGTISPIVDPFLEEGAEMGRNYVRGVQLASTPP